MSDKQKEILGSIANSLSKMSTEDQSRLEGIATGMALAKPQEVQSEDNN